MTQTNKLNDTVSVELGAYQEHFFLFMLKFAWIVAAPLIVILGILVITPDKSPLEQLMVLSGAVIFYFSLMLGVEKAVVLNNAKNNNSENLHKRGNKVKKIIEGVFSPNKTLVSMILTVAVIIIGMPLQFPVYVYLIVPFCVVLYKSTGAVRSYYETHIRVF